MKFKQALIVAAAALLFLAATPRLPDPRWQTVGSGSFAARPPSCTGPPQVYLCTGPDCPAIGGYLLCIGGVWVNPFTVGTGPIFVDGERPSVNATTGAVTLAFAPNPSSSLHLSVNGLIQTAGEDYTLSGNVVMPVPLTIETFKAAVVVRADYRR